MALDFCQTPCREKSVKWRKGGRGGCGPWYAVYVWTTLQVSHNADDTHTSERRRAALAAALRHFRLLDSVNVFHIELCLSLPQLCQRQAVFDGHQQAPQLFGFRQVLCMVQRIQ